MAYNEQALRNAVEQSAAVLTAAGFPKMPARMLMTLLVSPEGGLTAAEIGGQLGVSPAAVSGAVRYLESLGIVRRIAQAGSRRDRYELPEDAWYVAVATKSPIYTLLAGLAEDAVTALDDPESAAAARLDEMARFYRFLETRLPQLMQEWEEVRDSV